MAHATSLDWHDVFLTAALEPERWPEALQVMADHTGATHGQLIGLGGARDVPFNIVTQFDPDQLQHFIDIDGGSPAVNFRVAANQQRVARGDYDPLIYEKDYDAALPLLQTDRYVRFCEDMDIPFGCQINLVVDRVGLIGLATLRKRREGRTTRAQRQTFAAAAVAARQAVRLQERLEGEQAKLLAGAFEAVAATAFVFDARGRLQAMTTSAEALLKAGDIMLRDQSLEAAAVPVTLGEAIRALVGEQGLDHVRLRVEGQRGRQPLFMEGFRLPSRPWSLGNVPCAILLVRPPQRDRAGIAALLSALYRMTAAEADVAIRLFEGRSRAEISDLRAVTAETLRGQIKSIYAKTGSASEADLMRLLSAIMT